MLGYHDFVYLFHFLFIGPLLVYIGYYKEKAPKEIFSLVLAFGAFVTLYHAYSFGKSMYFKSSIKVV